MDDALPGFFPGNSRLDPAVQPLRFFKLLFQFGPIWRTIAAWKPLCPSFVGAIHRDAFHDFEREVDRLLSSVNFAFQGIRLGRQYPSVNLYELPDEYLLTAELLRFEG